MQSLEIVGGGSKRALGRPTRTDHALDLGALRGIVDYDPAELVLTARTATPMAEIEGQLKAHRQMLAFEPPDWRACSPTVARPAIASPRWAASSPATWPVPGAFALAPPGTTFWDLQR
jgi:glycolate oxidase FAD binding subunit